MRYRTRKRLAIVILLLALPAYLAAVLWVLSLFERPAWWVELAVYVALGVLWVLPLRRIFLGIGREAPPGER
ncbi:MAG: DUF2842 domain-containing protein [Alphaproteobacteria bacterium]|nr:MAG: DUF2842 domain-containing protein [Alphaproteobacteria bacterium]